MEAKVDIRKLQVLNDRINQTLEALNQVRLTVHGLGHSPYGAFGQQGFGSPMSGGGSFGQSFGYGNPFQSMGPMGGIGLQHSTPFNPYGNPFVNPMTQGYGIGGINPINSIGQINPQNTWGSQGGFNPTGGLFHSNDVVEQRANDPTRITQTFPYALSPQNPQQNYPTW